MKTKTLSVLSLAVLLATGLVAQQSFITTESQNGQWGTGYLALGNLSNWQHIGDRDSTALELKDGKLYVTHSTHTACFAAVNPGCSGHGKTWRDVYASSNGVVVLERTISQVLVTRTNISTTQTLEWPEDK